MPPTWVSITAWGQPGPHLGRLMTDGFTWVSSAPAADRHSAYLARTASGLGVDDSRSEGTGSDESRPGRELGAALGLGESMTATDLSPGKDGG
ncbi:hypothetical protein Nepgr_025434 [Nepenthes gracilis]|uniref:Uncharacterized protein n=1 Tax=Nepenthes gracilis TaxID=150966 RepID=A0AAD3T6P7_NEPGR|nr:hypothetical protein Nepgr_025434 [Nepenthes gracilis]